MLAIQPGFSYDLKRLPSSETSFLHLILNDRIYIHSRKFCGLLSMLSVDRLHGVEWWNDRWMMNGNILEGSGRYLVKALSGICPEGLRRTTKSLSQESSCCGRDSNRLSIEYESGALPLRRLIQFHGFVSAKLAYWSSAFEWLEI
jgi:hypothetical protein